MLDWWALRSEPSFVYCVDVVVGQEIGLKLGPDSLVVGSVDGDDEGAVVGGLLHTVAAV